MHTTHNANLYVCLYTNNNINKQKQRNTYVCINKQSHWNHNKSNNKSIISHSSKPNKTTQNTTLYIYISTMMINKNQTKTQIIKNNRTTHTNNTYTKQITNNNITHVAKKQTQIQTNINHKTKQTKIKNKNI